MVKIVLILELKPRNLDRKEYNSVVQNHSDHLYNFALKFLRNESDAQDIVQDVFEKLWLNRKKVDVSKAKSWMFTTAYHAMINLLNKAKRSISMEQEPITQSVRPEASIFESNQVVQRAVGILPPIQRSIILLRDLEGYSYEEIGEVLNISNAQVKVYLFRARKKIKKQLKGLVELV